MSDTLHDLKRRWSPERLDTLEKVAKEPSAGQNTIMVLDLVYALRQVLHEQTEIKQTEDLTEVEYFSLDGDSDLVTVEDWLKGFQRLGISLFRTGEPDEETKAMLERVKATLR